MKSKYKYGSKILDDAYDKYFQGKKITYEEYVILLATNDEIWFCYQDTMYQVIHESIETTSMYITQYNGKQKTSERGENYSSVVELLEKFRIEGKRINEIWDGVVFK